MYTESNETLRLKSASIREIRRADLVRIANIDLDYLENPFNFSNNAHHIYISNTFVKLKIHWQAKGICFDAFIRNHFRWQAKLVQSLEKLILYKYMEAFSPKPSSSASKVHLAWPSARLPREQFFVDLRRIVRHQVLGEVYRVLLNILFSPAIANERTPIPISCIS